MIGNPNHDNYMNFFSHSSYAIRLCANRITAVENKRIDPFGDG